MVGPGKTDSSTDVPIGLSGTNLTSICSGSTERVACSSGGSNTTLSVPESTESICPDISGALSFGQCDGSPPPLSCVSWPLSWVWQPLCTERVWLDWCDAGSTTTSVCWGGIIIGTLPMARPAARLDPERSTARPFSRMLGDGLIVASSKARRLLQQTISSKHVNQLNTSHAHRLPHDLGLACDSLSSVQV